MFSYAWHDILGNLGVFLIVGSYLLLQLGKISGLSLAYSGINAGGACLILVSLYFNFNFSAALVEGFWLAISLLGFIRTSTKREGLRAGPKH